MRARTVGPGVLGTCLSIAACIGPGAALASFCGSPSPALLALGQAYFELETTTTESELDARVDTASVDIAHRDPRRANVSRLERLRERLERSAPTGGHGERVVCQETRGKWREITWIFDLERIERIETLDGGALLTAYESRHTVRATPPDDHLVDGTLAGESIDLPSRWRTDTAASTLRANRRLRRVATASASCASFCTYMTETALHARPADDGGVELEWILYIDGFASERAIWRFGWHRGS